jgi:RimJ/RimL family protein N-acetyltransferase
VRRDGIVLPPQPITLDGRHVRLEPLERRHGAALLAVADPEVFRWFSGPTPLDPAGVEAYVAAAAAGVDRVPFAVVDRASGRAVGSTSYLAIVPEHERLEIGSTWLARSHWRTATNTEAKLLLLGHAFDTLGAGRVEFKTDALNVRSRRALERLGARPEGVFRRHMVMPDGRRRDSAWYAVTAEEWPSVRAGLEARLSAR